MILGIDPGLDGALAFWNGDVGHPLVEIHDMPTFTIRGKRSVDLYGAAGIIRRAAPEWAVVEDVASMPKQGVASSFKFGFNAGAVQGLLAAFSTPITLTRPAQWKRAMGLTADKDASRRLASRLFPTYAHLWPLKKHDGRAEALLLAVWSERHAK